jgi:hypothetical protein
MTIPRKKKGKKKHEFPGQEGYLKLLQEIIVKRR